MVIITIHYVHFNTSFVHCVIEIDDLPYVQYLTASYDFLVENNTVTVYYSKLIRETMRRRTFHVSISVSARSAFRYTNSCLPGEIRRGKFVSIVNNTRMRFVCRSLHYSVYSTLMWTFYAEWWTGMLTDPGWFTDIAYEWNEWIVAREYFTDLDEFQNSKHYNVARHNSSCCTSYLHLGLEGGEEECLTIGTVENEIANTFKSNGKNTHVQYTMIVFVTSRQ